MPFMPQIRPGETSKMNTDGWAKLLRGNCHGNQVRPHARRRARLAA
jgi:hypothetical protein